jgi:hypothetical protein
MANGPVEMREKEEVHDGLRLLVGGARERPRALEIVRGRDDGEPELERPSRRHDPFLPGLAEPAPAARYSDPVPPP